MMRNILFLIAFFWCFNALSQEEPIYTYRQKDSTLIISGKGVIQHYDVNKYSKKCVRVIIKEGIEGIQFGSFYGFRFMKEIQFPNTLRYIGKDAFCHCTSLKSVELPPKVRGIMESFIECDNLKSITFPDTIYIDLRAFQDCKKLKKLSFVYLSGFSSSYLEGCESMESIEVKDSTCPYKTRDGVLYRDDRVIIYPYAKKDKSYRFPDSIRMIEMLKNPYVEEIYVSDDIWKIYLHPCENLKVIRSENKIFYEKNDEGIKMDSLVIQVTRHGRPLR